MPIKTEEFLKDRLNMKFFISNQKIDTTPARLTRLLQDYFEVAIQDELEERTTFSYKKFIKELAPFLSKQYGESTAITLFKLKSALDEKNQYEKGKYK